MKVFTILFVFGNAIVIAHASMLKGVTDNRNHQESRILEEYSDIDLGDIIGIGCFSERATVQIQGHTDPVSIQDLKVGDHVLTAGNQYSPVYAFGHHNTQKEATFVQLETRTRTLELTGDHLVYLNGKANPVRADSIERGDVVRGQNAGMKVFGVQSVQREGVYAPLTPGGTVIVDGIVASSYVSLNPESKEYVELQNGMRIMSQQDYVHMGLSPFRLACQGLPAFWSQAVCDTDNDDGMPAYVSLALRLNRGIYKCQSVARQSMMLFGVVVLTGTCLLVESIFGATHAPSVLLAFAGMYALARILKFKVRATIKFS